MVKEPAPLGHNSQRPIVADALKGFITRIENLNDEKAALAADIKEVYGEAKSMGFDPKTMRKIVSLRKVDEAKRAEAQMVLDTYLSALGMDLFQHAGITG